jgi:hypothetical protein
MAFADASESSIAFIEEVTFGVTPATPAFLQMRTTGEQLTGEQQSLVSNELRADAEVADLIRVGVAASGATPYELQFGTEFHTLLEHALRGTFAASSADTTVTALSVGAINTFDRASGSFITDGFKFGQRITSSGFTDGANNGNFTVVNVAALVLTIAESTLVVEGAGADEQIVSIGSELIAGIEKKSVTLEKIHELGTPDAYFRYRGCRLGTLNLTTTQRQIMTGSMTWQGLGETTDTAIISGATYTPANTNPIMAAADVATIAVYNANLTGSFFYTDLVIDLNNNLRVQGAIGQVEAAGIGYGRRNITGSLNAYFENLDLYNEAVANNDVGVAFNVSDGSNVYNIVLPKCKFSTRQAFAGGNNQDILAALEFQAILDSTVGASIRIDRT